MGAISVSPQNASPQNNGDDFQAAVNQRMAVLPPKARGYLTIASVVFGVALFAAYGPNDIWTSLLVGAVAGGIASNLAFRAFFAGIEAWHTRRLHLAVVAIGLIAIIAIWFSAR